MRKRDEKRLAEFVAKKGKRPYEHKSQAASPTRSPDHRARPSARPCGETKFWNWEEVTTFPGELEADYFEPAQRKPVRH